MSAEPLATAANLCQGAVPLLSLLAYLPQWRKLLQTRSSAAISVRAWCVWTVSSACALFYAVVQLGLTGRGWVLVISCLLALLFVLYTLILVLRFRPRTTASPNRVDGEP